MNNFDHAVSATNTAIDSQGSAMRENSAYMESIQAKLSQLQSTFQDFANNVISSDLAKTVLDLANGLLQIANTDLGQIVTQIVLLTGLGWGATSLTKALGIFKVGIEQFKILGQVAGAAGAAGGGITSVADAFAASQAQAGAQDVWPAVEGAFTGEISPRMLQDAGAVWVLTGHSERRHVLGESDELVGRKTAFALEQGLKVMLCIGEKLEERESGQLEDVLRRQLDSGLPAGGDALEGRFAVAYEPVWAIGTGKVAGPDEVLATHAVVRRLLCERLGETGNRIPILYGGSVKPANAGNLIGLDNVDGLLIGGASLDAQSFVQIIRA